MLSIPLLTFAIGQIINNDEFVETKKRVDFVGESQSHETCMRVREGSVWAFYGARSVVERCYDFNNTF